jgi:hypothetical protein
MTHTLECDFETRSDIDLRKHGAYVYFESPNARVLLGSFKYGNERFRWDDLGDGAPPARYVELVEQGVMTSAHNRAFEALCLKWLHENRGWPLPAPEQARCTAATSAALQLPRSLDKLGQALDLDVKKDKEGMRLIRKFSIPQKGGHFIEPEDDPEDFEKFHAYCDVDVETEAEADERMVPLSDAEQAVYVLSEKINNRGIRIDVESAQAALRIADKAKLQLDHQMREITGGAVRKCSEVAKLTAWVNEQGVEVASLAKADLDDALAYPDLPSHVREALETRQEAAKTSTAKVKAMLDRASRDGRVRGTFLYHGAGTGRWTNMGVNFANMPRPRKTYEPLRQDLVFEAIRTGDPDYLRFLYGPDLGRPLHLLSDAIRGFIMAAPGHDLVQADYSGIEGAVVAWLADERWKLDEMHKIIADPSIPDLYRQTAAGILSLPLDEVTKSHWARQAVGKPAELACFAPDTQILTSNGAKAIVEVTTDDLLWDGVEWVKHKGVVAKSARRTVDVDGIGVTEDHLILTGRTWRPAWELASNPDTLGRALATGSGSLPWSASIRGQRAACAGSWSSVLAGSRSILSRLATSDPANPQDATPAQRRKLGKLAQRCITATTTLCRTPSIASGFSTAFRRAIRAALTPKHATLAPTVGAVLPSHGAGIAAPFSNTSLLLTGGMTRAWNWTVSTWTGLTGLGICGSRPKARTRKTKDASTQCPQDCSTLNPRSGACGPVYDILLAGPRNRFTVLSDSGAMIAHNCGYQGGVSAFYTFARNGGVDLDSVAPSVLASADGAAREKAEKRYEANYKRNQARARELSHDAWVACEIIKNGWREQNAAIAQSWKDLEAAAREAVENPGTVAEAARVKYVVRFGFLWALLPSGRCLAYGAPRLKAQVWAKVKLEDGSWSDAEVMDRADAERGERAGKVQIDGNTSDKVTTMTVDSTTKKWRRQGMYGGLWCENNTQAVARDLLVNGMFKAEKAGYPVIAHVYDEIISEVPRGYGDLSAFEQLICELPDWAEGLPLTAGGWRGKRYRKD